MLAGQAHEIETRYRQATPASQARDAEHRRTLMEARAQRHDADRGRDRQRLSRPHSHVREWLAASRQMLQRMASLAR